MLRIEASAEITKKTGLGRAVGIAASQSMSGFMSSNRRGDIYLTITTDRDTYVLHQDPPTDSAMKTVRRLESAGRTVIDAAERATASTTVDSLAAKAPVAEPNEACAATPVAKRLEQLEELRVSGLVTDDEYKRKRAQILDAF